jgi:cytochrome P450
MTVESTQEKDQYSLGCPHLQETDSTEKLPNEITACLRPATQHEIDAHQRELSSRSYASVLCDKAKDVADRLDNTARLVWNLDFRANLGRSIHNDPYLSLHKIVGRSFYVTAHPAVIKAVLKDYHNDETESSCFHIDERDIRTIELLRNVFDDEEITTDDFLLLASKKPTQKYRRFLHQYFSSGKTKEMLSSIGDLANSTIQEWFERGSESINITSETKIFATSVMSKLFLGYSGPYTEMCRSIDNILVYSVKTLLNQSISKDFQAQLEIDKEVLKTRVDEAMATKSSSDENISLVQAMIGSDDFNERQVKVMTFVLFFAGQETTASALNYVILKCTQDKKLQSTVRSEMQSIIDEEKCSVAEAATKSPTIKQIIVEGLRMLTPAYSLGRVTHKDLILELTHTNTGEVETRYIEKDTRINPCPTFAARHESIVSDKPNTFDHERLSADEIPKFLPNLPWFPLGGGPHSCPGWSVAYYEEMIMLGTLLYGYDIQTDLVGEPNQVGKFTATTENDVLISIEKVV